MYVQQNQLVLTDNDILQYNIELYYSNITLYMV